MRLPTQFAVAMIALVPNTGCTENAVQREHDKLQGTWQVLRQEFDGNDTNTAELRFVITPGKIVARNKNGEHTITYKLDPEAQPKTIELTFNPDTKRYTLAGIYLLDGDTLRICASDMGKPRPTEFTSPKGSRLTLYVLRRVKPGA